MTDQNNIVDRGNDVAGVAQTSKKTVTLSISELISVSLVLIGFGVTYGKILGLSGQIDSLREDIKAQSLVLAEVRDNVIQTHDNLASLNGCLWVYTKGAVPVLIPPTGVTSISPIPPATTPPSIIK